MLILKKLADNFFEDINPQFIKKKNGDVSKLNEDAKVKDFLAQDYIGFITEKMTHCFDVEKTVRFWEWSNSKEVITITLKEGQSDDIPLMPKLTDFLKKYYPSLTIEDISVITRSCDCKKVTSPSYDEYHEFYDTSTRSMTLRALSKQLEPYISSKEYINIEEVMQNFSEIISAMNVSEYQSFMLSGKLERNLSSHRKTHSIKI